MVEAIPAVTYVDEPTSGGPGRGRDDDVRESAASSRCSGYPPGASSPMPGLSVRADPSRGPRGSSRARGVFSVNDLNPFDEVYRMRHRTATGYGCRTPRRPGAARRRKRGVLPGLHVRRHAAEGKPRSRSGSPRNAIARSSRTRRPSRTRRCRQPLGFDQATSTAYVSPQIEQLLGYAAAEWRRSPAGRRWSTPMT
mgnify:CR=1 FL=1